MAKAVEPAMEALNTTELGLPNTGKKATCLQVFHGVEPKTWPNAKLRDGIGNGPRRNVNLLKNIGLRTRSGGRNYWTERN